MTANALGGRAGDRGRADLAAAGVLGVAAVGAATTVTARAVLRRRPPCGAAVWHRVNHRGAPVTLLAGPSTAAGAMLAAALTPGLSARQQVATVLAGGLSGCLGAHDDLSGSASSRGFRGHAAALRRGQVTTGAVKVLGIGAAGLLAGGLLREGVLDRVLAGGVVAGTANLVNLLDLRPGRALKAGLLLGLPEILGAHDRAARGVAAAVVGAALAALPDDLGERAMLGDAGANALGALLGLAAASRSSRRDLVIRLGVLAALTAASEKVSFTRVIAATPGLRELDALGRRT